MQKIIYWGIVVLFLGCGGGGSSSSVTSEPYSSLNLYEDAQDGSVERWSVRVGEEGDVENLFDEEIQSRVIEFGAGGSYMIGAIVGDQAWGDTENFTISFELNSGLKETIYVLVDTQEGARKLFYRTDTPTRGLKHSFIGGIHHGLGSSLTDGRWRTLTRDLVADLHDAEPNNQLLRVNGFIHNGGEGNRLDDLLLYEPIKEEYLDVEQFVTDHFVLDLDDDRHNILQWRFKDFGDEPRIMSADPDERGTVLDPEAFEFRVVVDTLEGERDLVYRLGMEDLGIIEEGHAIEHALGDDRTIGSVWAGDDPMNELGLWQHVTRDLEEDIRDFEPQNRLLRVRRFEVSNRGRIADVVMFSSPFFQRSAP